MPSIPSYLQNHQAVIHAFGYWPSFHDSPVLSFRVEEDSIFLEVEVWEMSDGTDTQGFLKLTKRHIVEFEFHDIVSTDLEQFTPENILFELEFSSNQQRQEQGFFKVVLDSVMGSDCSGEFRVRAGSVLSLRPSSTTHNKTDKS